MVGRETRFGSIKRNPRYLSTPSGEVLGFVADGKIYLDPSKINPETIAEEFIHLQQQAL